LGLGVKDTRNPKEKNSNSCDENDNDSQKSSKSAKSSKNKNEKPKKNSLTLFGNFKIFRGSKKKILKQQNQEKQKQIEQARRQSGKETQEDNASANEYGSDYVIKDYQDNGPGKYISRESIGSGVSHDPVID